MEGWIKLHRQLLESEIFANQIALKIWIWLLLKANHTPQFVSLNVGNGFTEINLTPGQLLFGRFKAEEILNINGSTIYKWLQKMEQHEMITIISNNKYSIISICNYENYQNINDGKVTTDEQQANNKRTTSEQQANTYNNVNKEKNVKKIKIEDINIYTDEQKNLFQCFQKWIIENAPRVNELKNTFTISEYLKLVKIYDKEKIKDIFIRMHNYKDLTKKYVSAYLTAINWLKRNDK
jgi:hypothetical protein